MGVKQEDGGASWGEMVVVHFVLFLSSANLGEIRPWLGLRQLPSYLKVAHGCLPAASMLISVSQTARVLAPGSQQWWSWGLETHGLDSPPSMFLFCCCNETLGAE